MTILTKLKTAKDILATMVSHPSQVAKLLRNLPYMSRGIEAAGSWPSSEMPTGPDSNEDNPLLQYARNREDVRGLWKKFHYFDVYHQHLAKFVGQEVSVLEIGIYSGGSLPMWRHYLGDRCHVYGVDIDPSCMAYEDDHTTILIGDQADRDFWEKVRQRIPQVDLVLDDGGHLTHQQIVSFEEMMPHIRPGGLYLCEDVQQRFNGFTGYVYGLMQGLNDVGPISENRAATQRFQAEIAAIHCYPYMVGVEKRQTRLEHLVDTKFGTQWKPWPGGVR